MGRATYKRSEKSIAKQEKLFAQLSPDLKDHIILNQLRQEIESEVRERVHAEEKQKAADATNQDIYYVFFIAFGLALKDKLPNWGAVALGKLIQTVMDWIDIYIKQWDRDMERFQNEFAIRYGERLEIDFKNSEPWW